MDSEDWRLPFFLAITTGVLLGGVALAPIVYPFEGAMEATDRPHDPWVFRSTLDGRVGILTAALHDSLWVAYDPAHGRLYRAWPRGVNFAGAVYTGSNGTHPTSKGPAYISNPAQADVWMVSTEDTTLSVTPKFLGYHLDDNRVTLRYRLQVPNSEIAITVEETPKVAFDGNGQLGLVRNFRTRNLPENTEVLLRVSLQSLSSPQQARTNGKFVHADTSRFSQEFGPSFGINGRLRLRRNTLTHLTTYFERRAVTLGSDRPGQGASSGGQVPASVSGEALYQSRCASCHQQDGRGLSGVYPPMSSSQWVTGDKGRLLRILLHGMTGSMEVDGETYSGVMPAWASSMSDKELAAVASYIRDGWGNNASAVSAEEVAGLRKALSDRTKPWTAEELQSSSHQGIPKAGDGDASSSTVSDGEGAEKPVARFGAVSTGPTIDGTVDKVWANAENRSLTHVMSGESPTSRGDLSGQIRVLWDANALYVLAEVTDDVLINDSNNPWSDDGIEVYVDAGGERSSSYDENDEQYVLDIGERNAFFAKMGRAAGVERARTFTDDGYRMEVAIPWSTLGETPKDGKQIGFDVAVNDDDEGGSPQTKYAWQAQGGGLHSSPDLMAPVLLEDPEGIAGDATERASGPETGSSPDNGPKRVPGLSAEVYRVDTEMDRIGTLVYNQRPNVSKVLSALTLSAANEDFGVQKGGLFTQVEGVLQVSQSGIYDFRVTAADGARLIIDDEELITFEGRHPDGKTKESTLDLGSGEHFLRVEHFSSSESAGAARLQLEWRPPGADDFASIPTSVLRTRAEREPTTAPGAKRVVGATRTTFPGDRAPLDAVHPSYDLATVRPPGFEPRVGGMDVLSDGRIVLSSWEADGGVYVVDGATTAGEREDITARRIAEGLYEPLGLAAVPADEIAGDTPGTWDGQRIFVMQKHELTELIDHNGDFVADEYRTVSDEWGATGNFHEFGFGLTYEKDHLWGSLAIAIQPGGASADNQNPDRGSIVKVDPTDGSTTFVADGLRVPNGIGRGYDGDLYVSDNQGDWLPASKILHVKVGAFYGNRSVDPHSGEEPTPPVVWLPQGEIGNSPSEPIPMRDGPYDGQMLHGDVTHGGIKRVFVEKVNGVRQGAVFRFTQGLEAGVNRLGWGPGPADHPSLYVGGVGSGGNWGQPGKRLFGLQRMTYNGSSAFEMLSVRARPNGLAVTFTEPLADDAGEQPEDYQVEQWHYKPTENYGGPKLGQETLPVESVQVQENRRRVILEIPGIEDEHVVYLRLQKDGFRSDTGRELWSTEAWYTMNEIPSAASAAE